MYPPDVTGLNGLMQTDVAGLPLPDIGWLACIVVRLLTHSHLEFL